MPEYLEGPEQTGREMDIVEDTWTDFGQKQVERNVFAQQCQEIAELIWPEQSNTFYYGSWNFPGTKLTQRQISSTGMDALEKCTAIVDSMITPQHMVWSHLGPDDPY